MKPVWMFVVMLVLGTAAPCLGAPTPEQQARCALSQTDRGRSFCLTGYGVPALSFPTVIQEGGDHYTAQMALYKPSGNGPFPAIVLMHTCSYLSNNDQMPFWVRNGVQRGYVVFVLDSFTQRGVTGDAGCGPAGFPNPYPIRSRDAYDALAYLAGLSFVDTAHVAVMGFSQGARTAYYLGSQRVGKAFSHGQRFAAVIALYGQCFSPTHKLDYILPDIKTPMLALLGGVDTDGDPHACLPRLQQASQAGAPVSWHVFPDTGHAWDHPSRVPAKQMPFEDPPGSTVLFGYRRDVTDQSRDMVFEFLAKAMK